MRLFGYIRVSRVMGREGDSFLSPDDQRRKIDLWAQTHGHEIAEVFEDLDVSGGSMDRPAFAEMMLRCGEVDGVAVAKLDRFARTLVGALDSIKHLTDAGVQFVSVSEGVDPSNAAGRMMLNLLLVLAEFERDRITEGWANTVATVVAQGKWPAQRPFGYDKGKDKRLYVNPFEAEYVRGIFSRRTQAEPWASIALWLNSEAVPTRRGGSWTPNTVKDLIPNRVYLGEVRKGEYVNPQGHEPIVTLAEWQAAQNVHKIVQSSNGNGNGYLLAGVLRCAGCSYTASGSSYGRAGQQTRQYVCRGHHGSGDCTARMSINADTIEQYVTERFFEAMGDIEAQTAEDCPEIDDAQRKLDDAEARLVAYRDDLTLQEILGRDSYLDGLRSRVEAVEAAKVRLSAAKRKASGVQLPDRATVMAMWPDLTIKERNKLLRAAFDAIFVKRGRGDVENRTLIMRRGEAPDDLPRKGKSAPVTPRDW